MPMDHTPLTPPPQVALYDTPGVTSAVRSREHGARVQGAWQVAQHCGVVLFLVDAARQVRCHTRCRPAGAGPGWRPVRLPRTGPAFALGAVARSGLYRSALQLWGGAVYSGRRKEGEIILYFLLYFT